MRSSGERGSAVLGAKGAAVGSSLVAISSRVRVPAAREERVRASPEKSEQSATAGSRQQAERGARVLQKWRDAGLCSSHRLGERTQPVLRSLQRGGWPARRPRADEDERGREPGSGGALDWLRACRQGSSSRTASPLSQFEPCRERARTAPGANPSARACRPRPLSRLDLLLDKHRLHGCTGLIQLHPDTRPRPPPPLSRPGLARAVRPRARSPTRRHSFRQLYRPSSSRRTRLGHGSTRAKVDRVLRRRSSRSASALSRVGSEPAIPPRLPQPLFARLEHREQLSTSAGVCGRAGSARRGDEDERETFRAGYDPIGSGAPRATVSSPGARKAGQSGRERRRV